MGQYTKTSRIEVGGQATEKNAWICIEKAKSNFGAYAPEVPGCVTTGKTVEETRESMIEALAFHFEGMMEDGESLDSITDRFPADAIKGDDNYWTLVRVDVVIPEAKAGV